MKLHETPMNPLFWAISKAFDIIVFKFTVYPFPDGRVVVTDFTNQFAGLSQRDTALRNAISPAAIEGNLPYEPG
jgi:hypothetical protein